MVGSPLARATEAPGGGGTGVRRPTTGCCRGASGSDVGTVGPLEQILLGPSSVADGSMNLVGALRRAMATTGYTEVKEFQRVEVTVLR